MGRNRRWTLRLVWYLLVPAAALLFADSARAGDARRRPDCQDLVAAIVNTTLRRSGTDGTDCFETVTAAAGLLKLDVDVTDPAAAEPRVDFWGRACEASRLPGDGYELLEALASSLWIEVEDAGRWVFCVTAQDPRSGPGHYKLRVALAERLHLKGGDPTEHEPDPDPLVFGGGPMTSRLCRTGEVDDHGDTRTCSTPVRLGEALDGEIANAWGDDEDYFAVFVARGLRPTVEIDVSASNGAMAVDLFDRRGHHLAGTDDEDDDQHVRLFKTLSGPAWYFVRVHGGRDRVEGPYRLSSKVLTWR